LLHPQCGITLPGAQLVPLLFVVVVVAAAVVVVVGGAQLLPAQEPEFILQHFDPQQPTAVPQLPNQPHDPETAKTFE
jgi:hypothetical protein